jgi:hypothetical protein
VSDVTVSYEYDNVALDVVKGGAFLEPTAIQPRGLETYAKSFLVPATDA